MKKYLVYPKKISSVKSLTESEFINLKDTVHGIVS